MSAVLSSFPTLRPVDSLPARLVRIWSPTYRSLVRFEWAVWAVSGNYAPEFEDLNRYDAARMLREVRQRGGKLIKTADGYYAEVAQ